jgi:hypothetical protein
MIFEESSAVYLDKHVKPIKDSSEIGGVIEFYDRQ